MKEATGKYVGVQAISSLAESKGQGHRDNNFVLRGGETLAREASDRVRLVR